FGRNLTIGSTGEDVRALQILLNQSTDTRLAALGAGSPNNETTYFGQITRAAVKRFQEKYASEILSPIGLAVGTGFVGPATRAKLNQLTTTSGQNSSQPQDISDLGRVIEAILITNSKTPEDSPLGSDSQGESSGVTGKPMITAISPTTGSAGTKVTITGRGFLSSDNTVYTGYDKQTVSSSDGRTIKFTFNPPFASAASGKTSYLDFDSIPFRFYVGNVNGLSAASPEFKLKF
ncbi:MAG: hypothetical protein COV09_01445, partial [Candidatus Vogelbacteria bacterium CG10_big_fil_rev_8_21_14_0_10_50_13]